MDQKKVITLEDRIPKLKNERKQRANRRLIFYLSFFFILLLAVIYFQSPLSNVQVIDITGNHYISDDEILNVSGLSEGTSFWGINSNKIENEISAFNEISDVSVKRKFPHTVQINVNEFSRVAYLAVDSKNFPILETGEILQEVPINYFPSDAPLLMGWKTNNELAELAAELSNLPESIIHRISEIYYTPVESDPLRITVYMNDGFKVSSTIRHFSKRMVDYPAIVNELEPGKKGIIHMKMNPYFEHFDNGEEQEIESEG